MTNKAVDYTCKVSGATLEVDTALKSKNRICIGSHQKNDGWPVFLDKEQAQQIVAQLQEWLDSVE